MRCFHLPRRVLIGLPGGFPNRNTVEGELVPVDSTTLVFNRKVLIRVASEFIENQRVTHYFTLTYPRRFGWEGRHKVFDAWLDGIEWMQRRPLGWFRADEMRRYSGCGFPEIPEHHHGLLVDTDHLCCRTAESLWRQFGDALVERYEPHGGAIPYCLKHAFDECGDWAIGGKALRPGFGREPQCPA